MNWSTYEGEDTADTNYGELGPAMQAFESWVELNYNSGAYSVLEFAYESDNENLAEEGCQRFGANSFMEGIADNMDNVYGQALPTWKHIKQQVASIIDPTGRYGSGVPCLRTGWRICDYGPRSGNGCCGQTVCSALAAS